MKIGICAGGNPPDLAESGISANGLYESDITLAIALKLKPLLEANGIDAIITKGDDNVDAFIYLRVNVGGGTGVEGYISKAASDAERLAGSILPYVANAAGFSNRGAKIVTGTPLDTITVPAIEILNGFIDSEADAAKLKDTNVLQAIAVGYAKGICDYFSATYTAPGSNTVGPDKSVNIELKEDPPEVRGPATVVTDIMPGKTIAEPEETADSNKASEPTEGDTQSTEGGYTAPSVGAWSTGEPLQAAITTEDIKNIVAASLENAGITKNGVVSSEPITFAGVLNSLVSKMNTNTFWLGVVGVAKLASDAYGIKLPSEQWDDIANALAVLCGAVGVIASHAKLHR